VPLFDDITFEKAQQKENHQGRRSVSFLLGNHDAEDKQKDSNDGGRGAVARQAMVVTAVCIQFLTSGYGIGFSAPSLGQVKEEELLTSTELEYFASSLVVGQVVGSLLGPLLADKIGRKRTCLMAAFSSMAAWVLLSTSHTGWLLLLARALTGLADCTAGPPGMLFICEVAATNLRGTFLNSVTIASGVGIALAYLVGGSVHWQNASLLPPLLAMAAALILIFTKESPVSRLKDPEDAKQILLWYRGDVKRAHLEEELDQMTLDSKASPGLAKSLVVLLSKQHRKPFFVLFVLFALYPLTGMYNIAFFAIDLFEKLGIGNEQAVAVSSALARALGTCFSSLLIHRLGRRRLYLPSAVLSSVTIGLTGALHFAKEANWISETLSSWAMVVLLLLFMFSVGVAVVTFPWVLMAEWFPPSLKGLVTGILVTLQFGFIFLAVQLSSTLLQLLGTGGLFLYFSAVSVLNLIVVVVFVPETHGLTYLESKERHTNIETHES